MPEQTKPWLGSIAILHSVDTRDYRYNYPMTPQTLSFSIVIPALNEANTLPNLLQDLATQDGVHFETIVVDGGSQDNTRSICENFPARAEIRLLLLASEAGRARQMNEGTKHATTNDYLFLHADTRIKNTRLLSEAIKSVNDARMQKHPLQIAGHFPLRFSPAKCGHKYYFYECKTHLNRPDCINGDQGIWIAKDYLEQLGGFDESLPYMEDARLAQKIFETGSWITLPGELESSSRRFEREGFVRRQILNSFLCNFNAMGVTRFFQSTVDVYKIQNETSRLNLRPFLRLAHQQMNGDGIKLAFQRWYQTGGYIAFNAWQLAFALDCRTRRKRGLPPGSDNCSRLQFFDKHLSRFTTWPVIKALTGLVTIIWFYSLFLVR